MGAVIGDVLFLALGVVIGPIPICVVLLLLTGSRGYTRGMGYMIGWIVGLTMLVIGASGFERGVGEWCWSLMGSLLVGDAQQLAHALIVSKNI